MTYLTGIIAGLLLFAFIIFGLFDGSGNDDGPKLSGGH